MCGLYLEPENYSNLKLIANKFRVKSNHHTGLGYSPRDPHSAVTFCDFNLILNCIYSNPFEESKEVRSTAHAGLPRKPIYREYLEGMCVIHTLQATTQCRPTGSKPALAHCDVCGSSAVAAPLCRIDRFR